GVGQRATRKRVLLVEDNVAVHETYRLLLEKSGFEVVCATDADEALLLITRDTVDAVVVDVQMAGRDGLALVEALANWHTHLLPKVTLHTAYAYEDRGRAVADRYGIGLLEKPCPWDKPLETVQHLTVHADDVALHHAHEPALATRAIEDDGRLERALLAAVQEMDTVQAHAVCGRARPELHVGLDVGLRARHQANASSCAWGAQRGPQKRSEERGLANGSSQHAQARIHQPRGLISLRRKTNRLSGCTSRITRQRA